MSEAPPGDEVDCEVLNSFNGLDAGLIAAMLDSGGYSGQLVRQLWQSWPPSTRDAVLGEVEPEIREFFVREIHDAPSLAEALVVCLGLDEAKGLMNDLLRKAKDEASTTLKSRVVAITRALVTLHAAPKHDPLPSVPSPNPPTHITQFNEVSNRPPPAKTPPPSLSSSNHHHNVHPTLSTNTANLPAPGLVSLTPLDTANSHLPRGSSTQPLAHSPSPSCSPRRASASHVSPPTSTIDVPPVLFPDQPSSSLNANTAKPAAGESTPPSPRSRGHRQSPSLAESGPRSPTSTPPAEGVSQTKDGDKSTPATEADNAHATPATETDNANTTPATEAVQSDHEEEDSAALAEEDSKFHPKGWSIELNAKKVVEWGLEDAVDKDKRHTAAARTEWMYESRLNGRTEQEYAELTASEFRKFAAMPPLVRREAGMVFNKTSKFDYEARVLLGLVAFEYCKMTGEEGRKFMEKSLKKLEKRLPDISPEHERRRIDEDGPESVRRWWNDIKTWITTVAGKMRKILDVKGNAIQLLDAPKESAKYDPADLLGRKRAGVAYHLWGATDAGKEVCEPLIKAAVSEWAAANPGPAEDGRTKGQKALGFGQKIRQTQFGLQPDDVKAYFHKEAKTPDIPQTDEQRQGATEACLPWIIQILNQASTILGMHIVVLMSGRTLGGVPVVVKEFTNDAVETGSFLVDNVVGGRAKAEYLSYAANFYQADPAQLQLYDRSVAGATAKESHEEKPSQSKNSSTSAPMSTGKPKQRAKSLHRVFDPPPTLKARGSKGEFVSKFLGQWFAAVFAEKINWTKVSRDNSRYIELGRLPKDAAERTIQLMNPTAMTDDAFHLLWDHLYKSTRGQLADDVRFLWRGEDLHFNLPAVQPPADPSVHVAGEQSRKTKLGKRKRGGPKPGAKGGKSSRKKKRLADESVDDDSLDEFIEAAELSNADGPSTRELRHRKSSTQAPNVMDNSDKESSASESGDEYAPEKHAGEHIDINAYAIDGDSPMDEDYAEQGLMGAEDGVEAKRAAPSPNNDLNDVDDSFGGRVNGISMEVDLPVVGDVSGKGPVGGSTSMEEEDGALDGESGDRQKGINVESRDDTLMVEVDEAELAIRSQNEGLAEVDYDAMDWGPRSSLAVDEGLPLMEISLDAPKAQRSPTKNPAWDRFMAYLRLWGQKMSGVSKSSQVICLSQGVGKECSISIPPALDSAISIMQIWVSLQNHKPGKACPLTGHIDLVPYFRPVAQPDITIGVEPYLFLSSVPPRHHVRQAAELVLDVTKPLPSAKNLEVNLGLTPPALDALYTQFELGLVRFIFDLTATTEVVRYGEVQTLTALRLASFIHMSAFLRDPGKQGPTSSRIEQILDRLVIDLAATAVVRYMQEFLGSAVDEWLRKTRDDKPISSMWLALKVLWSPSVESLARAVVTKRADLFVDRWAESHLPAQTMAIVRHILTKPAWWETLLLGMPPPFQFGTKQRLFTPSLGASLLASEWPLLTFLDRSVMLLMLFACAVQLSGDEHRREQDVLSFTELLGAFCSKVNTSETEQGPFYSSAFHNDATQQEVQGWIAVWESERTVVVPSEAVPDDDIPPEVVPEATASNQGPAVLPASSSAASSPASPGEQTDVKPSVKAEEGSAGSSGNSHSDNDGVGVDGQDDAGDSTEHLIQTQGKKRKVRLGRPVVPEPSIGAGVNPKQRLQDAVKMAEASGALVLDERPRRTASLKSPYARNTAALRAKAEVAKAPASPEKKSAGKNPGKKPAALKKPEAAKKATASPSTKRRATAKELTTRKGAAVSSAEQPSLPLTRAQKKAATITKG